MVSVLSFPTRSPALDQPCFETFWRNDHVDHLRQSGWLDRFADRYVQYHPVQRRDDIERDLNHGIDHAGMNLISFADRAALDAALRETSWKRMFLLDLPGVCDMASEPLWFVANEKIQHDAGGPPPAEAVTLIGAARLPATMTSDTFSRYWGETHGPLAVATPDFIGHVHRCVQYHPRADAPDMGRHRRFGGIGVMTFSRLDAMGAAYDSSGFQRIIGRMVGR